MVVLLVVGAATVVLLRAEERAATQLLAATITAADDVDDPPLDIWLIIDGPTGVVSTAGLPAGVDDPAAFDAVAAGAPTADTIRHVRGIDYRVMTARRPNGTTVQAVLDLAARQQERARVLSAMLLTGAVGLLAAAALGSWLGRRALRPLSAALALQRRFVADAGHELRTPLTLLTTRAQLLHRRLRQVRDGLAVPRAWHDPVGGSPAPHAIANRAAVAGEGAPSGTTVAGTGPTWLSDARLAELALHDVEDVIADSTRLTAILEDLLLAADPLGRRVHRPGRPHRALPERPARRLGRRPRTQDPPDRAGPGCSARPGSRVDRGPAPRAHRAARQRAAPRPQHGVDLGDRSPRGAGGRGRRRSRYRPGAHSRACSRASRADLRRARRPATGTTAWACPSSRRSPPRTAAGSSSSIPDPAGGPSCGSRFP